MLEHAQCGGVCGEEKFPVRLAVESLLRVDLTALCCSRNSFFPARFAASGNNTSRARNQTGDYNWRVRPLKPLSCDRLLPRIEPVHVIHLGERQRLYPPCHTSHEFELV